MGEGLASGDDDELASMIWVDLWPLLYKAWVGWKGKRSWQLVRRRRWRMSEGRTGGLCTPVPALKLEEPSSESAPPSLPGTPPRRRACPGKFLDWPTPSHTSSCIVLRRDGSQSSILIIFIVLFLSFLLLMLGYKSSLLYKLLGETYFFKSLHQYQEAEDASDLRDNQMQRSMNVFESSKSSAEATSENNIGEGSSMHHREATIQYEDVEMKAYLKYSHIMIVISSVAIFGVFFAFLSNKIQDHRQHLKAFTTLLVLNLLFGLMLMAVAEVRPREQFWIAAAKVIKILSLGLILLTGFYIFIVVLITLK